MSIGNTKTQGNKGYNYPFQKAVLELLGIISNGAAAGCCPEVSRTPALLRATGAGSVAIGKRAVSVSNVGSANGTVLGTTIKPGETINIDAGSERDTLAAVAYDGTGTELLILTLV